MITFTVHEPPEAPADRIDRAEMLVFVKEGFNWAAAVFGPFWLIAKGLWLALLAYVLIVVAVGAALAAAGASDQTSAAMSLALHLILGFEADAIQRLTLDRRGWQMLGTVNGRDRDTCERRFFEAWLPAQPMMTMEFHGEPRTGTLAAADGDLALANAPPRGDRAAAGAGCSDASEPTMQRVVIIDYGSGNLHSAAKAFERAAREGASDARIVVSSTAEDIASADRIVLPGVGAFADCRRGLAAVPGMIETLETAVQSNGRPFLGICVGMQLLATRGLEHGATEGLGWIPGDVTAIMPADPALKVPHMGWNTLDERRPHPLLDGIRTGPDGLHAYFVHSYHLVPRNGGDVVAVTDYGGPVTAMVARDNIAGTQFHPEKSQALGLKLLANFLSWQP